MSLPRWREEPFLALVGWAAWYLLGPEWAMKHTRALGVLVYVLQLGLAALQRLAHAVWCRVAGSGAAYKFRCQAHVERWENDSDEPEWAIQAEFEKVPIADWPEWLKARRVMRALARRADPREAERQRAEERDQAYVDVAELNQRRNTSFGGGFPKARGPGYRPPGSNEL